MMKLLLIDDQPLVVKDMLSMFGYNVDIAEDGYEGIQKFAQNDYDLIILDVQMPRMDGWATLKYIRNGEQTPTIPIVMLTSLDDETSLVAGLRRGADEYLCKPITPGKLLAHIEAISRRSQWETKTNRHLNDPELDSIKSSFDLLTNRERELLQYIAKGCSNSKIGNELSISETTVKNHLAHIFKKLNVSNRTQAAYMAQKLSMV